MTSLVANTAEEKRKPRLVVRLRQIQTYGNYTEYKTYNETIDETCAALSAGDECRQLLERYVAMYPAFRMKPVGAPGSHARDEEERKMALEDAAIAALKSVRP